MRVAHRRVKAGAATHITNHPSTQGRTLTSDMVSRSTAELPPTNGSMRTRDSPPNMLFLLRPLARADAAAGRGASPPPPPSAPDAAEGSVGMDARSGLAPPPLPRSPPPGSPAIPIMLTRPLPATLVRRPRGDDGPVAGPLPPPLPPRPGEPMSAGGPLRPLMETRGRGPKPPPGPKPPLGLGAAARPLEDSRGESLLDWLRKRPKEERISSSDCEGGEKVREAQGQGRRGEE